MDKGDMGIGENSRTWVEKRTKKYDKETKMGPSCEKRSEKQVWHG